MIRKLLFTATFVAAVSLNAQNLFNSPKNNMKDVLKSDCCWLGQNKISGSAGFFFNKITYLDPANSSYKDYMRYGTSFNLTVKPYKEFQIRLFFYADLNNNPDKPQWLSNLFYNIGWYNWRNKTFSYGYENYQPNRFDGSYNWFENFKRGFFFVSYNYQLLNPGSKLHLDRWSQISLTPFVRYQYEYTDRYGIEVMGHHKIIAGSGVRWAIAKKFYVESAVYFYPVKNSQLPWDPDYTYGFGFFDWRSFKINLSYGNWIANRFPGRPAGMKNDFTNGEWKILFTFIW